MIQENSVICGDCLDVMRDMPDNSVDLVLTDPPYGIGAHSGIGKRKGEAVFTKYVDSSGWDDERPNKDCFLDIKRVSKEQIIFGANYFADLIGSFNRFIVWDKVIGDNCFSMAEIASCSINKPTKIFKHFTGGNRVSKNKELADKYTRVHPTQKPVALFKWCLENYSKPNDLIFDPFAGSFTTAIACLQTGRRYICVEKEEKYCEIGRKRIREYKNNEPETIIDGKTVVQGSLFNA